MNILIVTGMEGAENCAKTLTNLLGMECEAAQGTKNCHRSSQTQRIQGNCRG